MSVCVVHILLLTKIEKEKMGGKKRKIEIEKITDEALRTVTFSKRRTGLFSKASTLCYLYPQTQIAILTTPFAANSHASFYSFGHPSLDGIVNYFLGKQSELGFWWEDTRFDTSEDLDELTEAGDSILMILNKARSRLDDLEKSNQRDVSSVNRHHHHQEEDSNDQKDVSLVNHHHQEEEKVLQICNEETTDYIPKLEGAMTMPDYIPKLEGETSGAAHSFFENEENNYKLEDLLTEQEIEALLLQSCFS